MKNYIKISPFLLNGNIHGNDFHLKNSDTGDFLKEIYQHFEVKYPKFHKMDKLAKLGFLATDILLTKLGLTEKQKEHLSLLFFNQNATIHIDTLYEQSRKELPSPALFVYTLSNIVIGEICIKHKIYGENNFFILPDFDADKMIEQMDIEWSQTSTEHLITAWVDFEDIEHFKAFVFYESRPDYLKRNWIPKDLNNIFGA